MVSNTTDVQCLAIMEAVPPSDEREFYYLATNYNEALQITCNT